MSNLKIDGHCHCGAISYAAEVDSGEVVICHCTDCQILSGSAFRVVVPVVEGTFRLLSGSPKTYIKTAESGNKRLQAFCADCGTPLYGTAADGKSKFFGLRVGTITQREQLVPKSQVWCHSALGWIDGMGGMAKLERD